MVPVTPVAITETTVQVGDTGVKSAAAEPPRSTAVETAAVKSAKPAAMKSATAVKAPAPTASVRCVSKVWLADDGRAQQRGCDAHHRPFLLGPGFAIA